jgi:hypothetical protein
MNNYHKKDDTENKQLNECSMKTNGNCMLLFSGGYRLCNLTDIPCLARNKRESYLETY